MTPIIALIGRTNVGKSSFFNFLTKSKIALIDCIPGTTRDRNYSFFYIKKNKFCLIDTAGIESIHIKNKNNKKNLNHKIYKQTLLAIKEANFIFFMVDIDFGLTNIEHFILNKIRLKEKKIFLLINKIDFLKKKKNLLEFYDLGIKYTYKLSVMHKIGINFFLKDFYKFYKKEKIFHQLKEKKENKIEKNFTNKNILKKIQICIVGKSNVGKSTFINSIIKKDRMIIDHENDTTRGINYISITKNNKNYILVDTGGLKRKSKNNNFLEYISMIKTMNVIKESQVTVVVINAIIGICSKDLFIINHVLNTSQSFCIIVNKWDLVKKQNKKKIKNIIYQRLNFIKNNKIFFISSLLKIGLKKIFSLFYLIYKQSQKDFTPQFLTRIVSLAIKKHPIPMGVKGNITRLKYVHLGGKRPFIIVIHGTQTQNIEFSYKKYLVNFLQEKLNIPNTPIRLFFKNCYNPYIKKKL